MCEPAVSDFLGRFAQHPCGAAVKTSDELDAAVGSRACAVFLLRGSGLELAPVVRRIHDAEPTDGRPAALLTVEQRPRPAGRKSGWRW